MDPGARSKVLAALCGLSFGLSVRPAAAQWAVQAADTLGDTGYRTHLALDAAGLPHVAYTSMLPFALLYATRSAAGVWTTETVDGAAGTTESFFNALALDASGVPHIAYDSGAGHLAYATRVGPGAWSLTTVDADSLVGQTPSLAFDTLGRAVISYFDEARGRLKLAAQTAGGWSIAVLDSLGDAGWDTALALDAQNVPHVAYHDVATGELRYLIAGGTPHVVDEPGPLPALYNTSLVLDGTGRAHISYLDATHLDLRYAEERADGGWTLVTVDSLGETGGHTSLALDRLGLAHISYHDRTQGNLRYASQRADGTWQLETVDGLADSVGEMTALALDARDAPHITYHDKTYQNLAYAEGPEAAAAFAPVRPAPERGLVRVEDHAIVVEDAAPRSERIVAYAVDGRRLGTLWNGETPPGATLRLRWRVPPAFRGLALVVARDGDGRVAWSRRAMVTR